MRRANLPARRRERARLRHLAVPVEGLPASVKPLSELEAWGVSLGAEAETKRVDRCLFLTILTAHTITKVRAGMLNLATPSVRAYWAEAEPELAGLLDRLERTEDWTLDSLPSIAERLVALGHRLSQPGNAEKLAGVSRDQLLFFFAYLSTSKAFLIIRWLDEHHDGMGSAIVERLLSEDGQALVAEVVDPTLTGVMVQRLRVLQNTPYFSRLLAPTMLESIERAIHRYHEDPDHA